jgi:hypothetical protein
MHQHSGVIKPVAMASKHGDDASGEFQLGVQTESRSPTFPDQAFLLLRGAIGQPRHSNSQHNSTVNLEVLPAEALMWRVAPFGPGLPVHQVGSKSVPLGLLPPNLSTAWSQAAQSAP